MPLKYPVSVEVDGREYSREVEARTLLSEFLRDELGFTTVRVGCDRSACGSCTVLLDGLPVRSCALLAVQVDGRSVTTLRGLSKRPEGPGATASFHPVQEALVDLRSTGCGYCSSGIVLAANELRTRDGPPSRSEVRRALEGLGCRCAGPRQLQEAVELALDRTRQSDEDVEGES